MNTNINLIIDELKNEIANIKQKIAILETINYTEKEDIKIMKETILKNHEETNCKFTEIDKLKIIDLKSRFTMSIGIGITIVTSIAVPIILHLMGGN